MQAFIDKMFDLTVRAGLPVSDLDTNILNFSGVSKNVPHLKTGEKIEGLALLYRNIYLYDS